MVCKTIIGGSIPPRASKIFLSHCFLMPMEDTLPAIRDLLLMNIKDTGTSDLSWQHRYRTLR
jgi:hypothetical protein